MSLSTCSSVSCFFPNEEHDLLSKFSCATWGHPELLVKNLDASSTVAGVAEFIDLGEYFLAFQVLFRGIVQHPRILVRDEYRVALDALQGDKYHHGGYVIGHPGIGKSLFLVYLITRFLGQKQAVAFQLPASIPSHYAFFSEGGISIQSTHDGRPIFNCPSFVWALCDAAYHAVPSDIFMGLRDHVRVIQTTAPVFLDWKWSNQVGANRFVMDIWSTEEVRKLAILLNLDVECMTELAKKWGGVPRTLLDLLSKGEVEDETRSTAKEAVRECDTMLVKGVGLNLPDNAFYFIRPRNTPEEIIRRMLRPSISVPTQTLRCLLAEALKGENHAIKLGFFRALSRFEGTRQAAHDIYKSWLHSFLSTQGMTMQSKWIASSSRGNTTRKQNLQGTTAVISATQDAPVVWIPPFYWVPTTWNFPGIDSALILKKEIIAIQVVIAERHHSPPEMGLVELSKLLPDNLKDHSWRLLFVGMDEDWLTSMAMSNCGEIVSPTKKSSVQVGWSVVDPVRKDVIYKEFGNEFDPASDESVTVEVEQ